MDEELMVEKTTEEKKHNRRFLGWLSRNWSWLLAAVLTALFMLGVSIVGEIMPFGTNSMTSIDSVHQYIPFLTELRRKLLAGENLFYTWNIGMGLNFQSLMLYYMASPFNLILLFFTKKGLFAAFVLLISLKLSFAAGAFSFLMSRRREKVLNNAMITAFGVAYALNNYMVGYYWNIMWLDCIMVLPLIILGFDRLMKENKPALYILSLFYCLYCNYYIAFIVCIFLVLWFFASEHEDIEAFFFHGLKFAGSSLLAAAMSCFSLLTAYMAIMKTGTAGAEIPPWEFYGNVLEQHKKIFFLTKPLLHDNDDININLYCGVLAIVALLLFLLSDRIKWQERLRKGCMLVLIALSFDVHLLNFIWHGFHDQYGIPNRFSFVYIFTILYVGYEALARIRQTKLSRIIIAIVLSMGIMLALAWRTDLDVGIVSENILLGINLGLVAVYGVFLILRNRKVLNLTASAIVIGSIMIAEIMTNAALGYNANGLVDSTYYVKYIDSMEEAVKEVDEQEAVLSGGLYRADLTDPLMLDEATMHGLHSIGTFCSTVRGDTTDALGKLGFYSAQSEYLFHGGTELINTLMGVKYIYVRGDEYYGGVLSSYVVFKNDQVTVYENPRALSLVYGITPEMEKWDRSAMYEDTVWNKFTDILIGTEVFELTDVGLKVETVDCEAWTSSGNAYLVTYDNGNEKKMEIDGVFSVPKAGRYTLNLRASYVDKIKYIRNGEEQIYDRRQSELFDLGFLTPEDNVRIEVNFKEGHSDSGTVAFRILNERVDLVESISDMLKASELKVEEWDAGYIKGKMSCSTDMTLWSFIPYDEGWTILIDGEPVETKKIAEGFLGADIAAGDHEVELRFVSPGFKLGAVVSVAAWLIFVIVLIVNVRIRKREFENEALTEGES